MGDLVNDGDAMEAGVLIIPFPESSLSTATPAIFIVSYPLSQV